MVLAPILLFTYKKFIPLKNTLTALIANDLAKESELYIFSDGPRSSEDQEQIGQIRSYLNEITGFKKIHIQVSKDNKGLANSIIEGVSKILKTYDSVIVLEDDLVTSPNFLRFMNQGLHEYRNNNKVFSISGYTFPIEAPNNYHYDNYFTRRASSWGWGTWRDRWINIDWSIADYGSFSKDSKAKIEFNKMGSDMSYMLQRHMNGKINSWAIRWCYHQYKKNLLTVFPIESKILNIGFGAAATHTKEKYNRFASRLDVSCKAKFKFNQTAELDNWFIKQFIAKYSLKSRILYKLLNLIG